MAEVGVWSSSEEKKSLGIDEDDVLIMAVSFAG
jgi:hypothetical protein